MFFRENYTKCYVPKKGREKNRVLFGGYYGNIIGSPKANPAENQAAFHSIEQIDKTLDFQLYERDHCNSFSDRLCPTLERLIKSGIELHGNCSLNNPSPSTEE